MWFSLEITDPEIMCLLAKSLESYVYVTGFTKTDLMCTFSISRNTDLKY